MRLASVRGPLLLSLLARLWLALRLLRLLSWMLLSLPVRLLLSRLVLLLLLVLA